ncbi:uncharacterized protein DUF2194 [Roseivirga pacifica]|uniref:DUF2194 domain-containing protein n=1 Tax=Roseivirga pacifica TaxID=1267423 RepID=A0A1I0RHN9_9BACT|nr:DUF2194 domain-containing protein [Roseivirga pacifica]RKQ49638.1 uncharacterized protein DUF2194 [Roseivirga pacifica]SEW40332.1 hypothetical protein SAMN05216290_3577 [Roseivirga pacifica]
MIEREKNNTPVRSLLGLLVFALFACTSNQDDDASLEKADGGVGALVTYIVDNEHPLSQSTADLLSKAFDYTSIPYQERSITQVNSSKSFESSNRVIFINGTEGLKTDVKEALIAFVAKGGTLVFPSLNEDQKAGFLSGLKPDTNFSYDVEAAGIRFNSDLLPGMKGRAIYPKKQNFGFQAAQFSPALKVLATAINNPDYPVILEQRIGNGRVIHFNTNIPFEKQDRGLLFAAALRGLEGVQFPIANVSAIYIDDFPSPLYDMEMEPIKSEYGINQAEFVMNVWWPDMLRLSEKFSLPYTAYPCFNYDQLKEPPFTFHEWNLYKTKRQGKQVVGADWMTSQTLQNQFELAFHGYNHESLLKQVWEKPENIQDALEAVRKKWRVNGFGKFPTSYVPPSNYIDSTGLANLAQAMPELRYMASTYDGELWEGGDREYDVDPYEARFFDFPRVTSGYTFNDLKRYTHRSLQLFTGIWSHFIHPDDVFQTPDPNSTTAGDFEFRNKDNLHWKATVDGKKGMLPQWEEYLAEYVKLYPSQRFMRVTDAAKVTEDWRKTKYLYEQSGANLSVSKVSSNKWSNRNFFWKMYVAKQNEQRVQTTLEEKGLSYSKTPFFEGSLITIRTNQPELVFDSGDRLLANPIFSLEDVYGMVAEARADYYAEREELLTGAVVSEEVFVVEAPEVVTDSVEWYVANENLQAATDLLYKRLNEQAALDTATFNRYSTYLAYQEKPLEVWSYLEEVYSERSESLALAYLVHYLEQESYPNEVLNERWLYRQIKADPTNLGMINEYLTYFYDNQYQSSIEQILLRLNEMGPSAEAYALYIKYLIDFKPELLTTELDRKQPKDYPLLHNFANSIMYAFSDEGDIQQALLWADYASEASIMMKLQWWADLEAYNKMESVYKEYHQQNPNDVEPMRFVSNTFYDVGAYEKGALIAEEMAEVEEKENFRKRLNPDVIYFEPDVQKYLIVNTPSLFYADTLRRIERDLRYAENDAIEAITSFVEDNFNQSVWESSLLYHTKTKKLNQHSFSVNYSAVSDLVLDVPDPDNIDHSLYGLSYRYQTRENTDKPIFHATAGLMQDDVSNTFFHFGAGISKSGAKSFKSITYNYAPVKTGPAISKEIYWGELVGYYETGYDKFLQLSGSAVGTHYTTGALELAVTGRAYFNFNRDHKSRFSPFAEVFGSTANTVQENGNPFWMIDNRVYGGGGFAWTYGEDQTKKLYARIEGGYFLDSYTDSFLRLTGNFGFPIKEFTYVTGQFEFFNQALYYSNGFQIGLKHYFRRRKPYKYKPRDY